jgi:hypothetical protein
MIAFRKGFASPVFSIGFIVLASCALLAVPSSSQTWEQDLLAYWSFNEGSGTTAADYKGEANGTLNGNGSWLTGTDGKAAAFGSAVRFDPTDANNEGYISLPTGGNLANPNATALSISVWLKSDEDIPTMAEAYRSVFNSDDLQDYFIMYYDRETTNSAPSSPRTSPPPVPNRRHGYSKGVWVQCHCHLRWCQCHCLSECVQQATGPDRNHQEWADIRHRTQRHVRSPVLERRHRRPGHLEARSELHGNWPARGRFQRLFGLPFGRRLDPLLIPSNRKSTTVEIDSLERPQMRALFFFENRVGEPHAPPPAPAKKA